MKLVSFFLLLLFFECMKCGRQNRNQNASTYSTTVRRKKTLYVFRLGCYANGAHEMNLQRHTNTQKYIHSHVFHRFIHTERAYTYTQGRKKNTLALFLSHLSYVYYNANSVLTAMHICIHLVVQCCIHISYAHTDKWKSTLTHTHT